MDLPIDEALADDDGLSDRQSEIAKDLLGAHGKSTSQTNLVAFMGNVISACAPDGTGTRPGGTLDDLLNWD